MHRRLPEIVDRNTALFPSIYVPDPSDNVNQGIYIYLTDLLR